MARDPVFVLDASVFIEAARRYYAFDLAPRFWELLIQLAESGQIESIDRVRQELERGNDDLTKWASSEFHQAFASTDDQDVIASYGGIIQWVTSQPQFLDAAKAEFANGADGWLVAYAKARGRVVVTQEVPNPEVRRKVPIPNVCQAFNVAFVDTFEMLRRLGVRWTR